jgi:hypothetical protein
MVRELAVLCMLSTDALKSAGMKAKTGRVRKGKNHLTREEQVRNEIQSFLQALDSYPKRFSREPKISFEEHWRSIARDDMRSKVKTQSRTRFDSN